MGSRAGACSHQVAESCGHDHVSDDLCRAAVGVVGDLAMTVGPEFTRIAKQEPHKSYLKVLLTEAR